MRRWPIRACTWGHKGRSERPNPGSQGGVRRLRHKNQFSDSRDYRDGDFQRKHHAAGSAVAAQRILNGAARNERLITGDDIDEEAAKHCFYPDSFAALLDSFFLNVARERRTGKPTFGFEGLDPVSRLTEKEKENYDLLMGICQTNPPDFNVFSAKVLEYIKARKSGDLDREYFRGKTAIVTGGASGIGQALTETLLACGARKVVIADRNREMLFSEERRLNGEYKDKVRGIPCDVSDEESVKAMVTEAGQFFDGRIDLLINCAGVGHTGMFSETPDGAEIRERANMEVNDVKTLEGIFAVNFYGPLYGCRAVLPIMIKQGYGQIVNIISSSGMFPMAYQSAYASSKAALNALSLVLRYEYWDYGVKINSATPGTVATPIFRESGTPKGAQSPKESALRVLTGAAKNERLICGDDMDGLAVFACFHEGYGADLDEFFFKVTRSRRKGNLSDYGD